MTHIADTIRSIKTQLPPHAKLVAVSKYHPCESILEAYNAGQRIFGESHALEVRDKHQQLPKDIQWHFIGHLQTNKVKYIAPFVTLIHSADSPRLINEINKQGIKQNRIIPCLLQLHIAQEETKYGFTPEECIAYLESEPWKEFTGVRFAGCMCMASNVDDEQQIIQEFERAKHTYLYIKERFFANDPGFCECSWGMSDDYPLALQHGSTLVRIGSKIFGQRTYPSE